MHQPKIKMIFACTQEGNVFGNADKLPWSQHIKKDMELFKLFTNESVLIMGHKTYESLPCNLRNLPHLVVTTETDKNKVFNKKKENPDFVFKTLEDATINGVTMAEQLTQLYNMKPDVCIIGGTGILLEASHFVDEAMITEVVFRDKEKRYYDCPIYVDLEGIVEGLSTNSFISFEDTKLLKYNVPEGEIERLEIRHYQSIDGDSKKY